MTYTPYRVRHHIDCNPPHCRQAPARQYRPPKLLRHGSLGSLVRGASWKGVDSIGELDPDQGYPG